MCDPSAPAPDSSHSVPVVSVYLQGPQTLLGNTVGSGHRPHQPRPATFTADPPHTHTQAEATGLVLILQSEYCPELQGQ